MSREEELKNKYFDGNLTEEEKKLLEEGSKYLREHDADNYN